MLEFAYPVRPWASAYLAATFNDPNYDVNGAHHYHKGIDINLFGGGDADLGYPVQSMFPGTVIFANAAAGWGNLVLIRTDDWARRLAESIMSQELEVLDVLYAHVEQMSVAVGDSVNAGDHVGSIGKGDNDQYLAHLHLELRHQDRPAAEAQSGPDVLKAYLDPMAVMKVLPFSDFGNIFPPRRQTALVRGIGLEGGYYAAQKVVVTNLVDGKFYYRTEDVVPAHSAPASADSAGSGD